MKAIRQYEFGGPDTLRFEEVADPVPGEGQVRIAVEAAGVHLVDTTIRRGQPGPMPVPELPMTPGREVAGTVDALGAGVAQTWLGRAVVAHLGPASGGYAAMALAMAASLHDLPPGLDAPAAVTMIGTGRTAVGILDTAALGAGDIVLVTSAAGGLGALFVRAARTVGARVVGLAGGPAKVDRVRALGASAAVDYQEPGWPARVLDVLDGARPTVALDGVGGETGRAVLELLAAGGRLVLFGFSSGTPTAFTSADVVRGRLAVTWGLGPRLLRHGLRPLETRALAEAAAGRLVPLVHPPFALSDAAAAHRAMESRATSGKVVLAP